MVAAARSLMRSGDDTIQQAEKAGYVLARVGYAMRGVLYALMGIFTLYMAVGVGKSGKASQKGAIQSLAGEPGGMVMLILVIVGFAFYGLWLLSMGIRGNPRAEGWKPFLYRVKHLAKAGLHFFLAWFAFNLARGSSGGSGGSKKQEWTAKLIANPAGRILVGVIGLVVIIAGIMQFKKAYYDKFMQDMGIEALQGRRRKWITIVGRIGHYARGLILALVGLSFVLAAFRSDPSEAKSIDETLHEVASYPYGKAVLIFMALGFWCFGAFQVACAAWARME